MINPDPDDRKGYTCSPRTNFCAFPGDWHDSIAGCLTSANPPKRICGPTLLDTGTLGIHISSANAADLSDWSAGLEIAFKNESSAELSTKLFSNYAGLPSRISTTLVPNLPRTGILAGVLPYFDFSVLYDAEKGVIGLKQREPSVPRASVPSLAPQQPYELDALRARLSQCWKPPAGVRDSHVVLRINFRPDGSLAQEPVVVKGPVFALGQTLTESDKQAFTESAKQALRSCQPFTMLKPEHYKLWQEIEITFDQVIFNPHQPLGGG